jgi:hypothetical protein
MIDIGGNRSINPTQIAALEWDNRLYMNAGPDATLVITMIDGTKYRVRHQPQFLGGSDAYKIERQIKDMLLSA